MLVWFCGCGNQNHDEKPFKEEI